ncbi:hypothetical protein [Candidatus Amarobacter glycogenicus]|uniref:ammonium transporter n=1 Tax=Candidatus Amarobacter glycogenicus TaxID=3140699 RepID=UPI0031CC45F2
MVLPSAYLVYTAFISAIIYPFVVHWAWDAAGWMSAFNEDPFMGEGYVDFAGSGVVHMVGGTAALVGAKVVGPRMGKFNKDGSVNAIPGHNITSGMLGLFILWFGWYGFNPGSTLLLTGGFAALAGKVAVTTTLAACAAAVTAVVATKIKTNRYDLGLVANGVLGGLVGITAGCATVEPWAAVVIGIVAAIIVIYAVDLLDNVLKIDDPVGAAPVHLFTGLWGVIAVKALLFRKAAWRQRTAANPAPTGCSWRRAEQLMAQLIGAVTILAWTGALSAFIFLAIKYTMGLRVPPEEESGAWTCSSTASMPTRTSGLPAPASSARRAASEPGLRHKHAERMAGNVFETNPQTTRNTLANPPKRVSASLRHVETSPDSLLLIAGLLLLAKVSPTQSPSGSACPRCSRDPRRRFCWPAGRSDSLATTNSSATWATSASSS